MANLSHTVLVRLASLSFLLAFTVVVLGAYTRLTDAGLGCPDWPGCYGQIRAPMNGQEIQQAAAHYPYMSVNVEKAWTEMVHRYFAETLGVCIFLLAGIVLLKNRNTVAPNSLPFPRWLAILLVISVLAQGLLGMWTVTLRLLPLVVMGHLLGGFSTLGLLWLAYLYASAPPVTPPAGLIRLPKKLFYYALTALLFLGMQIALGGWTSANYAALICPDFPTCQGQWWPQVDFRAALTLLGGLHTSDPLTYMSSAGKSTIHIMHRIGALITFTVGISFAFALWRHHTTIPCSATQHWLKKVSRGLSGLLITQVACGIANVYFHLPLAVALLHHALAALLLLCLITITVKSFYLSRGPHAKLA